MKLSNETASTLSKMEKDYMGFSSSSSSEASSSVYSNEAGLELGLGLSLGGGGSSGGLGKIKGSSFGRILTAKDLPNGFSGRAAGSVSGTKRAAADSVSQTENGFASTGVRFFSFDHFSCIFDFLVLFFSISIISMQ